MAALAPALVATCAVLLAAATANAAAVRMGGGHLQADAQQEADRNVPSVFNNGAWDGVDPPDASKRPLTGYVAAVLCRDIYYKHLVDRKDAAEVARNFTRFASLFCDAMYELGADDCEPVEGPLSLVYAVVRAARSVILIIRGSGTPQNWIADIVSLRTKRVDDFGGGAQGTNVALGFYQVFIANRRAMLDRVAAAAHAAEAAAGGADVWVVGHSLGGAVGLMAGAYLRLHEGVDVRGVYVYGTPRVGDTTWARAYPLHEVTLRVENADDIVPTLPFGSDWRHVGTAQPVQACTGAAAAAAGGAVQQEGHGSEEDDGWAAILAATSATRDLPHARPQSRRLLRGAEAASIASGTGSGATPAAAQVAALEVQFPFPFVVTQHMIETYVQVLHSCLSRGQQGLVPGPEDPYVAR